MKSKLNMGALAVAMAFASGASAVEPETMPEVEVTAARSESLPSLSRSGLRSDDLARLRTNTSDAARLLDGQPGVSFYGAGGISSLPVIHGMADDRVRVNVDGMDIISACANHMNPPLSYVDPGNVESVDVYAGITPVSEGGDSIGGSILVNSQAPEFAQDGQGVLRKGSAGIFYRSNNSARGGHLSATVANEELSMRYSGSTVDAKNYTAGSAFKPAATITGSVVPGTVVAGDEVGSSAYKLQNHQLALGLRRDSDQIDLMLGLQNISKQGFPNQRMDMTGNDSKQVNLRYIGQYDWGEFEARVYDEHTRHTMDFLQDKQFLYPNNAQGMPMDTDGRNAGASIRGDIAFSDRDSFRLGSEYQRYRLSDWWSASGTGGMSPNTFWNINGGKRDRLGVFAEWEARWSRQLVSQLGIRGETVMMNTGTVQGYNTGATYLAAATAFNARDRKRTDNNLDLTALARYAPDMSRTFEAGYAVKARSPSLYERYTWSTNSTMVLNMNNWFGDGNGYVGNPDLRPEVAHTLSVAGNWHDAGRQKWELKASPYYTHVQNYIDAVPCAVTGVTCAARTDGFLNLSLANQSARLYGADVSGKVALVNDGTYGAVNVHAVLNYVRGKNLTSGDNLYRILPLNTKLAVVQSLKAWTNTLEVQLVAAKTKVQAARKEQATAGYGLLNVRSSYEWRQARVDFGIENLLNRYYADPMGGVYLGQGATMGTGVPYGMLVPGMGRSINTSVTVKF
jgi:iron complex outermembrane recepter protein